jgi:Asp-tRNA(Asn)/Glu-tRNA(Gln) amidotransferase A subunit family amidase
VVESGVRYDLKRILVPRLAGTALRALAAAVETPVLSSLLLARLVSDAGIAAFRDVRVDEVPVLDPPLPRFPPAPAAPIDTFALAAGAPRPPGFARESAADYGRAYREGKTSPEAVADRLVDALRRGDAMEPPLRALIAWREDDLREQAARSAERWRAGRPLSALDGVPIAVKDEVDQAGYPTTVGTRFLGAAPAAKDSAVVARLRAAGALLFGKANMIELGIDTLGFNAHHGTPRNPMTDERRYTGGSSSGSGAAVAAGLGPIAVGADGGGSIRIPAALCGIAGLKATHARISELGAFPLCWSVGHVGPLGATVRDVALAYAVMAGPVDGDPLSQTQPAPTLAGLGEGIGALRIGVYRAWFDDADAQVVAVCRGALDRLVARGARLVEIEIPDLELIRAAHVVTILAEMATTLGRYAEHRKDHGAAVRVNLAIARALTARDFVQAQRVRAHASAAFARAFESCDVIATPTTAIVAPRIRPDVFPDGESDLQTVSALMRFVFPFNLTGHPTLSVPAGTDAAGLPVGLQLVGKPWEEHVLLRAGEAVEAEATRRRPALWFSLLGG